MKWAPVPLFSEYLAGLISKGLKMKAYLFLFCLFYYFDIFFLLLFFVKRESWFKILKFWNFEILKFWDILKIFSKTLEKVVKNSMVFRKRICNVHKIWIYLSIAFSSYSECYEEFWDTVIVIWIIKINLQFFYDHTSFLIVML